MAGPETALVYHTRTRSSPRTGNSSSAMSPPQEETIHAEPRLPPMIRRPVPGCGALHGCRCFNAASPLTSQ